MSRVTIGTGAVDDIGEMLNQHMAVSGVLSSKAIQEETDLQPEESSVDPRPQEESSFDEGSSVDPKPQPLDPVVIISRPSMSEEEEEEAEKNVIVVDGSAVEPRNKEVSYVGEGFLQRPVPTLSFLLFPLSPLPSLPLSLLF